MSSLLYSLLEDIRNDYAPLFVYKWHILLALTIGAGPLYLWSHRQGEKEESTPNHDPNDTDPGLLKKYTEYRSYRVEATGFSYFCIRTFYRPHSQADKLPSEPLPLPLLVFIHGLGGSAAQFAPLLNSLANVGPSLAIDLPGCGLSQFEPRNWDAYTTQALAKLLAVIIDTYRDRKNSQGVVFVGHSMGCSLAALLCSTLSEGVGELPARAVGLIAICPRADPPTPEQTATIRRVLYLPVVFWDVLRKFDRRGGTESRSVKRMAGENADLETRKLQLRFNQQSESEVFRYMSNGLLAKFELDKQVDGLPGPDIWSSLDLPVFLISGESDQVTKPEEAEKISSLIQAAWEQNPRNGSSENVTAPNVQEKPSTSPQHPRPSRALKTTVLPAPAAHSLFFAPETCRTISGLIQSFLAEHVDERLSLGWQLHHLSTEGKWDVKNLEKWKAVEPISEPIGGVFRAMKTMREVDDRHCPKKFAEQWAGEVQAVIDISHENPVYDPRGLEKGGIEYHKFPTVSKLPPTEEECKEFNELVDRLRASTKPRNDSAKKVIAVHCHYGFNRTGLFIISYLVDRMGWRLQDALDEFANKRPPGIKHSYFVDTLFVRYTIGVKRSPTP